MNKKQYQYQSNFKYGYLETSVSAVAIELDKLLKTYKIKKHGEQFGCECSYNNDTYTMWQTNVLTYL